MPWLLEDPVGAAVQPVSAYFGELLACGRSSATLRSYGYDLLRWFRFLWAVEVSWERAGRVEARDFSRWIQATTKPRHRSAAREPRAAVNAVTGKPRPGPGYASATVVHSETVLRAFYDFHQEAGSGPIINPFPLDRARRAGRAGAHRNPMDAPKNQRVGRYRPSVPRRIPRAIPEVLFNELFAALPSNRDRALVAFYISTGARASELLGICRGDVDPGQQLVTVVRKGDRRAQPLPASPDAFVWLRLYQEDLGRAVPIGRSAPVWWTRRNPRVPLRYHAAYRMFSRVNQRLGANWTLHDLRHSAAHRMVRDPELPLTDVQWVLGHALLSTTQVYTTPARDEVIEDVRAHHARQARRHSEPPVPPPPAAGYNPRSLGVLFGRSS